MKKLYKVSTLSILALGIIHVCMTPFFFKRFTQESLWFASGGLMIIFISLFNFILIKDAGGERFVRVLCYSANVIGLVFAFAMFTLGWLRATPPLQSFFVLFLFVFETVAALKYSR